MVFTDSAPPPQVLLHKHVQILIENFIFTPLLFLDFNCQLLCSAERNAREKLRKEGFSLAHSCRRLCLQQLSTVTLSLRPNIKAANVQQRQKCFLQRVCKAESGEEGRRDRTVPKLQAQGPTPFEQTPPSSLRGLRLSCFESLHLLTHC